MHFCRQPPPRPRLRRDTHALLPAAPAPPAPSQKDTHALPAGTPAPPRLRRPSPGGGVRAWRYLVESRARVFPGLSPCSGPWWISPSGERLTGRGDTSPLPCLQIPILRFAGSPYSASSGIPRHFPGSPHPARACGAPPPPPLGWWQCLRYQVGRRAQEHGDHRHGGLPRRARAPPAGRGHRCRRVEKGPDRYSRRPHAFAAGTLKKDTLPAVTPSQACRRRSAAGAVLSARGAGSRPGPRRCSAARLSPRR